MDPDHAQKPARPSSCRRPSPSPRPPSPSRHRPRCATRFNSSSCPTTGRLGSGPIPASRRCWRSTRRRWPTSSRSRPGSATAAARPATPTEADDPLAWSAAKPEVLTCRRCGVPSPTTPTPPRTKGQEGPRGDGRGPAPGHPPLPLPRGRAREAALSRRAALPGRQARLRGPRVPGQGRPLRGGPPPRAARRAEGSRTGAARLRAPPPVRPGLSRLRDPLRPARLSRSSSSRPTCRLPTGAATGPASGTGRPASTCR